MTPLDDDELVEPTPLPRRNEMHYNRKVFEHVDWSHRGAYMQLKHGITLAVADEALGDPQRVVIDPDYNSESGQSVRIIGYSVTADDVITVIVLEHEGTAYGVNGWAANQKDRRFYAEGSEGEVDEQSD
jgi:uncharacterized DUF497 family protein